MPGTYMLRCSDGTYYVGSTRSLELRVWQHNEGVGSGLHEALSPRRARLDSRVLDVGEAFFWEKRIQGWSRAKREALVRGEYAALPALSKKDFSQQRADDPTG